MDRQTHMRHAPFRHSAQHNTRTHTHTHTDTHTRTANVHPSKSKKMWMAQRWDIIELEHRNTRRAHEELRPCGAMFTSTAPPDFPRRYSCLSCGSRALQLQGVRDRSPARTAACPSIAP